VDIRPDVCLSYAIFTTSIETSGIWNSTDLFGDNWFNEDVWVFTLYVLEPDSELSSSNNFSLKTMNNIWCVHIIISIL